MDTTDCTNCNGHGAYASGRTCPKCRGTGRALCTFCAQEPATAVDDDGLHTCDACRPILAADVCAHCREPSAIPIALAGGLPTCMECWPVWTRQHDTVIPEAPATIPAPANDEGAPLMPELVESLELLADAKAAGVPGYEAIYIVRKALQRRAGAR